MSDLYWLTDEQMARLEPYFPRSHGRPRVERDHFRKSQRAEMAGCAAGVRSAEDAVQPLEAMERQGCVHPDDGWPGEQGRRTEDDHDRCNLSQGTPHGIEPAGKKGGPGRLIGRTKGGMNTKLHAVTDANGRPISFFMTAGQVSDYTGAAALLDGLPKAQWLLGDRGYDAV